MGLNELRKPVYTITVNGSPMRLRCDLNALDYLERSCGGLEGASADLQSQKHMIRAFLLCNYPENAEAMENGDLAALKPSLWEVGEWFDPDTMEAVITELYKIAAESVTPPEGEKRLGKPETGAALQALSALSRLFGRQNLEEAWRIFGSQPQGKSSKG